jgi:hypothetical protein
VVGSLSLGRGQHRRRPTALALTLAEDNLVKGEAPAATFPGFDICDSGHVAGAEDGIKSSEIISAIEKIVFLKVIEPSSTK